MLLVLHSLDRECRTCNRNKRKRGLGVSGSKRDLMLWWGQNQWESCGGFSAALLLATRRVVAASIPSGTSGWWGGGWDSLLTNDAGHLAVVVWQRPVDTEGPRQRIFTFCLGRSCSRSNTWGLSLSPSPHYSERSGSA